MTKALKWLSRDVDKWSENKLLTFNTMHLYMYIATSSWCVKLNNHQKHLNNITGLTITIIQWLMLNSGHALAIGMNVLHLTPFTLKKLLTHSNQIH